jgi:uncharacterized DUF497 family protein
VEYEWDQKKAGTNLRKHGVSFGEATTVFLDPLAMTFDDPDHSASEHRFVTIGTSTNGRVLFVSTAEHGGNVRIISARRARRREIHGFEEGKF